MAGFSKFLVVGGEGGFGECPSLEAVASALGNQERLDFDARQEDIPAAWATLREEARPFFAAMRIWQADLRPLHA